MTLLSFPGASAERRWTGSLPPGSRSSPRKRKPGPLSGTPRAPAAQKVVAARVVLTRLAPPAAQMSLALYTYLISSWRRCYDCFHCFIFRLANGPKAL